MTINTKDRSKLKAYFVKNAIPTEQNFAELIDAQLNQADDGVFKIGNDPLSVVAAPGERKQALRLYRTYPATNPDWTICLNADTGVGGLGIDSADGKTRLVLDPTGNLGIGTTKPGEKLTVHGGDVSIQGGRYRRLKIVSDEYWAGIELVTLEVSADPNTTPDAHPHIDLTHGALDNPNYGIRLAAMSNTKLAITSLELPDIQESKDRMKLGIGIINPSEALDVNGSANIRGELILPNGWRLTTTGNSLEIKQNGQTVAFFSTGWDRFVVYKNLDRKAPYFYFNTQGDYGTYSGA